MLESHKSVVVIEYLRLMGVSFGCGFVLIQRQQIQNRKEQPIVRSRYSINVGVIDRFPSQQ